MRLFSLLGLVPKHILFRGVARNACYSCFPSSDPSTSANFKLDLVAHLYDRVCGSFYSLCIIRNALAGTFALEELANGAVQSAGADRLRIGTSLGAASLHVFGEGCGF